MEGFTTFTGIIPALAFHAITMFLGIMFIGLGQRKKQTVTAQ